MKDREIKALFMKAEERMIVDEKRKQETFDALVTEMGRREITVMPKKSILLGCLWYMDKLFYVIYGVLVCLGFAFVSVLQHAGAGKNEMVVFCMIGAGILSIMCILMIDRLFFGGMAELAASCYFSTKQCIAFCFVLSGAMNFVMLIFMCVYLGYFWRLGLLQVVLYVLTPYFTSSVAALGIFSTEIGRHTAYAMGICIIFSSIGYAVLASVPGALLATSLRIWGIACIAAGILFVMRIKKLFEQMEKGEVLCMN